MEIQRGMDLYQSPQDQAKDTDKKLKKAAKMYEQHFIREMVKAMRKTVKPSGLVKQNFAERIFKEKLDNEYIQGWSNRGGVGLGDMIYSQLKARFNPTGPMAIPPQGPIPLEQRMNQPSSGGPTEIPKNEKFHMIDSPQMPGSSQFIFQGPNDGYEVTSPWSGRVSEAFSTESGQTVVNVVHDNGLNSKMVFEGQTLKGLQGNIVEAGEKIGTVLGPGGTVSWRVSEFLKKA